MKRIPMGKWRRLQQASSTRGTLTVLAIDHRGPLRRAMAKLAPAMDPEVALAELKQDIVHALAPHASAVLLDPEIGLPHCLKLGVLPGQVGLIVAQDTGSTGDPASVSTGLVPNWSVSDTAIAGAAGSKLLVYYHPQAPDAQAVEETVRLIASACALHGLPLFLEPLTISPSSAAGKWNSAARRKAIVATARRLISLGVDILKVEFPIDVVEQPDPVIWREACLELTEASNVPWVLLSGGASWELFLQQAQVACEAGASGVMAGRAFWAEAVDANREARNKFLATAATERLRQLRTLCDATARPISRLLEPGF